MAGGPLLQTTGAVFYTDVDLPVGRRSWLSWRTGVLLLISEIAASVSGGTYIGGTFSLHPDRLEFHPNRLEQKLYKCTDLTLSLRLDRIAAVEPGRRFSADLSVTTTSGVVIHLRCAHRDHLIAALSRP